MARPQPTPGLSGKTAQRLESADVVQRATPPEAQSPATPSPTEEDDSADQPDESSDLVDAPDTDEFSE
jgi:hypothetical protein